MFRLNVFALLFTVFIFGCFVEEREIGPNTNYYSSSSQSNSSRSSSSRAIDVLLDSLSYQEQSYKIVKMGSQTWIAQNLNAKPKPNSGDSWCYGYWDENCAKYGRLYNWEAAMSVCPEGWKLPSKDDFDYLSDYEDVLKTTSVWHALLGGLKYEDEDRYFDFLNKEGFWWSSTEAGNRAYYYNLKSSGDKLRRYDEKKTYGYSVRCIKNS
jgi:hypothetical protein